MLGALFKPTAKIEPTMDLDAIESRKRRSESASHLLAETRRPSCGLSIFSTITCSPKKAVARASEEYSLFQHSDRDPRQRVMAQTRRQVRTAGRSVKFG